MKFAHNALEEDFENSKALKINQILDSTLLRVGSTSEQIKALCTEAVQHQFRAVCIAPTWITVAKTHLEQYPQKPLICTVVGFPNGTQKTETKAFETQLAVSEGADEIDFVLNAAFVKEKDWKQYEHECQGVVKAARGKLVKIILETAVLTPDEIFEASKRAALAGVHVIKTSTGFGSRGATLEDIETIAKALAEVEKVTGIKHGIKASGGIRTMQDAIAFAKAGATRVASSQGATLVSGNKVTTNY